MKSDTAENMIGKKFGKLIVLELDIEKTRIKKDKYYKCLCECGTVCSIYSSSLVTGNTRSCGCLNKNKNVKNNKFDLSGKFGIGFDAKGDIFYFDIDDFEKIKNYCWNIDKDGYARTTERATKKTFFMHRIIAEIKDPSIFIDHINKNPSDNRKENLRIATNQQNSINASTKITNTSGVSGVTKNNWTKNKWAVTIRINGKKCNLGYFDNIESAIIARLKAEKEYYGEFAPQRHLFEQYGIEQ